MPNTGRHSSLFHPCAAQCVSCRVSSANNLLLVEQGRGSRITLLAPSKPHQQAPTGSSAGSLGKNPSYNASTRCVGSSPSPVAAYVSLQQDWALKVFDELFYLHSWGEELALHSWAWCVWFLSDHVFVEISKPWGDGDLGFCCSPSPGMIWAEVHMKWVLPAREFYIWKMILFSVFVPKNTA